MVAVGGWRGEGRPGVGGGWWGLSPATERDSSTVGRANPVAIATACRTICLSTTIPVSLPVQTTHTQRERERGRERERERELSLIHI